MLTTTCPRCGSPVPVSLAAPDAVTCAACGFAGAPPPEVSAHLRDAQAVLESLDVRQRQLAGDRREALMGADLGVIVVFVGVGLLLLFAPLCMCGGIVNTLNGDDHAWFTSLDCAIVSPILAVVGPWMAWRHVRARRALIDACAAVPPRAAGEPSRCHVCGAPLETAGAQAVVRCGHCEADNVVGPAALRRAKARRLEGLATYADEVRSRADNANVGQGMTSVMMLVVGLYGVNVLVAMGLMIVGGGAVLVMRLLG